MQRWFSVTVVASVVLVPVPVLVLGLVEITEGQDGRRRNRGPREPMADFPLTPLPDSFTASADNPQWWGGLDESRY